MFKNHPSRGIRRKPNKTKPMKTKTKIPLLYGFISGFSFLLSCLNLYKSKVIVKENGIPAQVRLVSLLVSIKQLLSRKEYKEIYVRMAALKPSEILVTTNKRLTVEEKEKEWQECCKMDGYLSILNLCARMVRKNIITDMQAYALLGERVECLREHNDVRAYLREEPYTFEDLIWLLERKG